MSIFRSLVRSGGLGRWPLFLMSLVIFSGLVSHLSPVGVTAAPVQVAVAAPFELVVWPDKLWQAGGTSTQMVIGLRGINGFTGNVTVNVTGLPPAQGGGINGQITCESNCGPAGVAVGAPPWTVPVVNGQWKMFSPQPLPPSDTTTRYNDQTYTLTVTATAAGYDPVVKTATLYSEHQWEQPPQNQPETTYHRDGVPACAPINDGASQWVRPTNKQTVTAGGSVSFTCSWRAPADGGPFANEWVDGTALTFVSTHQDANPSYEPTITGSFSQASATFDKPQPPQFQGSTLVYDTSKDVVVTFAVQTTSLTPAGVYVFAFGSTNGNGFYRVAPDGVLTVQTASSPSPTSTTTTSSPSPTATETTSSPTPSVSTTTATSSPKPTVSSVASATPAPDVTTPTITPTATPTTQTPPRLVMTPVPHNDNQFDRATIVEPVTSQVVVPAATVGTGLAVITFGSVLGSLTGGTAAGAGGLVTGLSSFLLMVWNSLLELIGLRRRRYPWGTVFDVLTDRPVELAIVRLLAATGKLVETRVTDQSGRVGFLAEPGAYTFQIVKNGYRLATNHEAAGSQYQPLYTGKTFIISQRESAIHLNIPLKPLEPTKRRALGNLLGLLHRPALFVTLPLGVWNYTVFPSPATAAIIGLINFLIVSEWLVLRPRGVGLVTDQHHRPLGGIVLRLIRETDQKVLETQITDSTGHYSFLVRPGRYQLRIASPNWQPPAWLAEEVFVISHKLGGVIDQTVVLHENREDVSDGN